MASSHYDFRKGQPPPYQNADYFSKEFLDESFRQPGGWTTDSNIGFLPHDFSGRFFNIRNNKRVTTDQPANPQRRLLIFGGSTVYCSETPDSLTLPSHLQRLINSSEGLGGISVENFGSTSVTLRHQLFRLKSEQLSPGAIVVFYDGVNDLIQSLVYKDPEGTMADHYKRQFESLSPVGRLFFRVHRKVAPYSTFVSVFLKPGVPSETGESPPQEALTRLEEVSVKLLREAEAHCRSNQVTFVHFTQPSLLTVSKRNEYEESLLRNPTLTPPGIKVSLTAGSPFFSNAHRRSGVQGADLSDSLDSRTSDVFLDFCHVNHEGNAVIAARIAETLQNVIRAPKSNIAPVSDE